MKGNRRSDTRPEVALRAALHARGLRFRKDYLVRIPSFRATRIDIAFTKARMAVFVDGCFWHGCPDHGRVPSTNAHYWPAKLARTRDRDERLTHALEAHGWRVIRLWEHVPVDEAVHRVLDAMNRKPSP
jgi:DNA mismatch endonuclease (patch repair protein)